MFKLTNAEYADLERGVEEDDALGGWYEDKARYDWEPARGDGWRGQYMLRMPTRLHECFIARVEDEIVRRITDLADKLAGGGIEDGGKVAEELRRVCKGRSTTLEMHVPKLENSSQESASSGAHEAGVVKRSPDATFYHPAQPDWPCVVVEVSYSQQRKDLPRLAESYIIDSQHMIRCVVGLDIPYSDRAAKKKRDWTATASVWRPGWERDEEGEEVGICVVDVDRQPFRDASGTACAGALVLDLSDVLSSSVLDGRTILAPYSNITIPLADLTRHLAAAEVHHNAIPPPFSTATKKFRKRKLTPSEELSDNTESKYLRQEEAEREKERHGDEEWWAGSRRRTDKQQDVLEVVTERKRSLRRRTSGRAVGSAS